MIILISTLVAIFTAPLNLAVDFAFDEVLLAPTADTLKVHEQGSALHRAGRRMSQAVRGASVKVVGALSELGSEKKQRSISLYNKFHKISIESTRNIPPAAEVVQQLAIACTSNISQMVRENNEKRERMRRETTKTSNRKETTIDLVITDTHMPTNPERIYSQLVKELVSQRKQLLPSERDIFDQQWG